MKGDKEIWIDEVLNKTESFQRVEARANLFAGIQSRLESKVRQIEMVRAHTVWLAAASIALLFTLNLAVLSFSAQQKQTASHTSALTENSFDIYSNS